MNRIAHISQRTESTIGYTDRGQTREELKNACRDFESYLVGFVFKRSIQPLLVQETPFLSKHERWFRELLVDEIAASGRTNEVGLANYLYRELERTLDQ